MAGKCPKTGLEYTSLPKLKQFDDNRSLLMRVVEKRSSKGKGQKRVLNLRYDYIVLAELTTPVKVKRFLHVSQIKEAHFYDAPNKIRTTVLKFRPTVDKETQEAKDEVDLQFTQVQDSRNIVDDQQLFENVLKKVAAARKMEIDYHHATSLEELVRHSQLQKDRKGGYQSPSLVLKERRKSLPPEKGGIPESPISKAFNTLRTRSQSSSPTGSRGNTFSPTTSARTGSLPPQSPTSRTQRGKSAPPSSGLADADFGPMVGDSLNGSCSSMPSIRSRAVSIGVCNDSLLPPPITAPKALGGFTDPNLRFIRVIEKKSAKGPFQKRVLVLTHSKLILAQMNCAIKRYLSYEYIDHIYFQRKQKTNGKSVYQFLIKVPSEGVDVLFQQTHDDRNDDNEDQDEFQRVMQNILKARSLEIPFERLPEQPDLVREATLQKPENWVKPTRKIIDSPSSPAKQRTSSWFGGMSRRNSKPPESPQSSVPRQRQNAEAVPTSPSVVPALASPPPAKKRNGTGASDGGLTANGMPDQGPIVADLFDGLENDEQLVFRALGNVNTNQQWSDVRRMFKKQHPTFHEGDPISAMKTELRGRDYKRCEEILTSKGITIGGPLLRPEDCAASTNSGEPMVRLNSALKRQKSEKEEEVSPPVSPTVLRQSIQAELPQALAELQAITVPQALTCAFNDPNTKVLFIRVVERVSSAGHTAPRVVVVTPTHFIMTTLMGSIKRYIPIVNIQAAFMTRDPVRHYLLSTPTEDSDLYFITSRDERNPDEPQTALMEVLVKIFELRNLPFPHSEVSSAEDLKEYKRQPNRRKASIAPAAMGGVCSVTGLTTAVCPAALQEAVLLDLLYIRVVECYRGGEHTKAVLALNHATLCLTVNGTKTTIDVKDIESIVMQVIDHGGVPVTLYLLKTADRDILVALTYDERNATHDQDSLRDVLRDLLAYYNTEFEEKQLSSTDDIMSHVRPEPAQPAQPVSEPAQPLQTEPAPEPAQPTQPAPPVEAESSPQPAQPAPPVVQPEPSSPVHGEPAVEKEERRAPPGLQIIETPAEFKRFSDPNLLCIRVVEKISTKGLKQKRLLMLTTTRLIVADEKNNIVKRYINVELITDMSLQMTTIKHSFFGKEEQVYTILLRVPSEGLDLLFVQSYDSRNQNGDQEEFPRILRALLAHTGKSLVERHVSPSENMAESAVLKKVDTYKSPELHIKEKIAHKQTENAVDEMFGAKPASMPPSAEQTPEQMPTPAPALVEQAPAQSATPEAVEPLRVPVHEATSIEAQELECLRAEVASFRSPGAAEELRTRNEKLQESLKKEEQRSEELKTLVDYLHNESTNGQTPEAVDSLEVVRMQSEIQTLKKERGDMEVRLKQVLAQQTTVAPQDGQAQAQAQAPPASMKPKKAPSPDTQVDYSKLSEGFVVTLTKIGVEPHEMSVFNVLAIRQGAELGDVSTAELKEYLPGPLVRRILRAAGFQSGKTDYHTCVPIGEESPSRSSRKEEKARKIAQERLRIVQSENASLRETIQILKEQIRVLRGHRGIPLPPMLDYDMHSPTSFSSTSAFSPSPAHSPAPHTTPAPVPPRPKRDLSQDRSSIRVPSECDSKRSTDSKSARSAERARLKAEARAAQEELDRRLKEEEQKKIAAARQAEEQRQREAMRMEQMAQRAKKAREEAEEAEKQRQAARERELQERKQREVQAQLEAEEDEITRQVIAIAKEEKAKLDAEKEAEEQAQPSAPEVPKVETVQPAEPAPVPSVEPAEEVEAAKPAAPAEVTESAPAPVAEQPAPTEEVTPAESAPTEEPVPAEPALAEQTEQVTAAPTVEQPTPTEESVPAEKTESAPMPVVEQPAPTEVNPVAAEEPKVAESVPEVEPKVAEPSAEVQEEPKVAESVPEVQEEPKVAEPAEEHEGPKVAAEVQEEPKVAELVPEVQEEAQEEPKAEPAVQEESVRELPVVQEEAVPEITAPEHEPTEDVKIAAEPTPAEEVKTAPEPVAEQEPEPVTRDVEDEVTQARRPRPVELVATEAVGNGDVREESLTPVHVEGTPVLPTADSSAFSETGASEPEPVVATKADVPPIKDMPTNVPAEVVQRLPEGDDDAVSSTTGTASRKHESRVSSRRSSVKAEGDFMAMIGQDYDEVPKGAFTGLDDVQPNATVDSTDDES